MDHEMDHEMDHKIDHEISTSVCDRKVPKYEFDLDKPADQRWGPILADFKDVLPKLKSTIETTVRNCGISSYKLEQLVSQHSDHIMFQDELMFIASTIGIEFSKIVFMQLL